MTDSETYRKGLEVFRQLEGDENFEQVLVRRQDPVTGKFLDVATEAVLGVLWTRPGLDLKTRTFICVISDAATGREPELAIHLRWALRQGWTQDELLEALLHLTGYVGAPLARGAVAVAKRVFEKLPEAPEGGRPTP